MVIKLYVIFDFVFFYLWQCHWPKLHKFYLLLLVWHIQFEQNLIVTLITLNPYPDIFPNKMEEKMMQFMKIMSVNKILQVFVINSQDSWWQMWLDVSQVSQPHSSHRRLMFDVSSDHYLMIMSHLSLTILPSYHWYLQDQQMSNISLYIISVSVMIMILPKLVKMFSFFNPTWCLI